MGEVDRVSLVSGLILLALGGILILDQVEAFDLTLNIAAAALAAAAGAILLVSGLREGDREAAARARGWPPPAETVRDDPGR
jgi:membrane protein DedA with SNARE-associated domain